MPLCNMMAMQHRKNKRGLQQLSDAQKLEAITKVQKGETKAAVAREFGVPESTLRGWCKKAKLNGHCQTVMNKTLQVTSTMSPVLLTSEMAYRDCGYSKGSGSEVGSATLPFSDEVEDEDTEQKAQVVIPEEQRRVLDWLHFGHYSQPGQIIDKPAQPVVTSSTCDEKVIPVAPKTSKKDKTQSVKGFGFYNWCKSNTSCGGYSSPVSPASDDKNDLYEDEPLALIVPSKRRISDLDHSWQLTKVLERQNNRQTLTVEEALQHGEVFLEWLRASSDPNVTVLQAMQIGALIKNIRSSLQRNQNRR